MEPTRLSFIQQLQDGSGDSWRELDRVYRPLIVYWLRRHGLHNNDAEDVAQEAMAQVAQLVGSFEHNGRVGAFRNWLRTITVNACRNFSRKAKRFPQSFGGTTFQEMLEKLQDENSDVSREFNLEHDQHVLLELLKMVSKQFQPDTIEVFRLHVMEGVSADEVAEKQGVTPQAVYVAKSRVLRSLRQVATDWIDDLSFF